MPETAQDMENESFRPHVEAFAALIGARHVRSTPEELAPYLTEERGLYPVMAPCVLRPGSTDDVSRLLAYCHAHAIPVVPLGGNTGMVGGTAAPRGHVLLSLERLRQAPRVDAVNATVTVEAGCTLKTAQDAALEAGLYLPLSLAAEGSAQIGGILATNAGGINVLRYGNARDFCLGIEAVLADGRVLRDLNALRKNNTGYDLRDLLIGSEGTLAVITGAVLRLHPAPRSRCTALIGLASATDALSLYSRMRGLFGDRIAAFEFISAPAWKMLAAHMRDRASPLAGEHQAYVLMELASTAEDPDLEERLQNGLADAFEAGLVEDATLAASDTQRAALWEMRERLAEAQKQAHADIKHDVAVPVSALADFIAAGQAAAEAVMPGIVCAPFGHFGDGNLHFNFAPPPGMAVADFRARAGDVHRAVIAVCLRYGGSFSAEHGVGRAKTGEMARHKDPVALDMMRAIKQALDPKNILNPGAVL